MQACKPGSVLRINGAPIIYLVASSLTGSISLPTPIFRLLPEVKRAAQDRGLFDLSTRKVCRALHVTIEPVSSYLTFSPFPRPEKSEWSSLFSVALSVPATTSRNGAFLLGSTLPCVARTFLGAMGATIRRLAYAKLMLIC